MLLQTAYCQWTWVPHLYSAVVWDERMGSPTRTNFFYERPDKFVPLGKWDEVQNWLTPTPDKVGRSAMQAEEVGSWLT